MGVKDTQTDKQTDWWFDKPILIFGKWAKIETKIFKYTNLLFYVLFCMGVKSDLSR
jgi:hypothetical protein